MKLNQISFWHVDNIRLIRLAALGLCEYFIDGLLPSVLK